MNREEALHTLGLGPDATPEDIKTAYKETAQILHPDRFAGNKKLADRATEQFKNLQEAYEYLSSGAGSRQAGGSGGRARATYSREDQLNARLAGIDAARMQLVAQRDSFLDQRRTGIMLAVGGLLAAFLLRRIRPLAAIAGAALVWGVVDLIASGRNLDAVNKQLDLLKKERNAILDQLGAEDEDAWPDDEEDEEDASYEADAEYEDDEDAEYDADYDEDAEYDADYDEDAEAAN